MAFLDRCYISDFRLYRDRPDVLTRGRWYWCPPGAKIVPYYHVFGTQFQESDQHRIDPVVGEVPGRLGWSDGKANPRYTGQNWCGSEYVWTHGALYSQRGTPAVDADGVPLCCQSLPADPGGPAMDGDGDFRFTTLALGGERDAAGTLIPAPPAGGGERDGGTALPPVKAGEIDGATGRLARPGAGELDSAGGTLLAGGAGEIDGASPSPVPVHTGAGERDSGRANLSGSGPVAAGELDGSSAAPGLRNLTLSGEVDGGDGTFALDAAGGELAGEEAPSAGLADGGEVDGAEPPVSNVTPAVGAELDGGDAIIVGPPGPSPGPTCSTAGTLALSQVGPDAGAVSQTDWWVIPAVAGGSYTLTFTTVAGTSWTVNVNSGTCGSQTTVLTAVGAGVYPISWPGGDLYIEVDVVSAVGAWSYTVEVS